MGLHVSFLDHVGRVYPCPNARVQAQTGQAHQVRAVSVKQRFKGLDLSGLDLLYQLHRFIIQLGVFHG